MKTIPCCTLLFSTALTAGAVERSVQRPNIIFFLVDDMGWQDTSLPFWKDTTDLNRKYHTPNMERLAAIGTKFTDAYACPVSSPSRISLMTGTNVAQHKVSNWTLNKNQGTDAPSDSLTFGQWNFNGMSPVPGIENAFYATPLAQVFKDNGYTTLFVGKAHFGALDTPAEDPLTLGFDRNVAGHAAGAMGSYLGEENYGNHPAGSYSPPWGVPMLEEYHGTGTFLTEALTLEASKLIDSSLLADKPFFLYMSHYAVHAPFKADMRFVQKYRDRGLSETEAEYAAIVEGMDKSLGDLMDLVEKKGIADNTIIVFMSDNGGYSVGGRQGDSNAPLRGGKGACFEGGIREPMIVYWPGVTDGGTVNATPVIIEDFYLTLLAMAGIRDYETVQHIDGRDFTPALTKGSGARSIWKERPLYFHYPNNWGERSSDVGLPSSAIRMGDWKLVHFYEDAHNELYNLREDISEQHDLLKEPTRKYKKIASKLARKLSDHLRSNGANMPIRKSTGQRAAYPDEVL